MLRLKGSCLIKKKKKKKGRKGNQIDNWYHEKPQKREHNSDSRLR